MTTQDIDDAENKSSDASMTRKPADCPGTSLINTLIQFTADASLQLEEIKRDVVSPLVVLSSASAFGQMRSYSWG